MESLSTNPFGILFIFSLILLVGIRIIQLILHSYLKVREMQFANRILELRKKYHKNIKFHRISVYELISIEPHPRLKKLKKVNFKYYRGMNRGLANSDGMMGINIVKDYGTMPNPMPYIEMWIDLPKNKFSRDEEWAITYRNLIISKEDYNRFKQDGILSFIK